MRFAGTIGLCLVVLLCGACAERGNTAIHRVVVLGVDGLDYSLVRELMARGRMPNFDRLSKAGHFSALATSTPPQSPVAWSSFITGLDPGGHGIFDFIHRDPKTMQPFLSTTRTVAARRIAVAGWRLPLSSDRVELLRRGEAFWEPLARQGIETTIVRMPANFPPSRKATRELSGMGTPDLLGSYGTFTWFTSDPLTARRELSGGIVVPVDVIDGVVRAAIEGPENPYLLEPQKARVELTGYIDSARRYVKLVVGDQERLLQTGEWSDWVPVELKLLPFVSLAGQCRFYVKQLEPSFEMYASPINVDPLKPVLPISTPPGYAAQLGRATGRYYTQGMPEDTKALKAGLLSVPEFLEQARIAGDEARRQFTYVFNRFDSGFLFYYFGNIDQVSHMIWRSMDPGHPAYRPEDAQYRTVLEELYAGMDQLVGSTLSQLRADDLLIVMSDHGFASWRRSFNLNSWLRDNGYLVVRDSSRAMSANSFDNIDWARTRAYALGLNGLYINVRDREVNGIVSAGDRERLADEIGRRLKDVVDPSTGSRVVTSVFARTTGSDVPEVRGFAPDLVVGFAKGVRASDESSLGVVTSDVFADNVSAWSGDHCMDPAAVPGILLTSRRLRKSAPNLQSLAGAIVAEFGIGDFPGTVEENK